VAGLAVVALVIGYVLYPCLLIDRSLRAGLHLRAVRCVVEVKAQLPRNQRPPWLNAALTWQTPDRWRFEITSSEGDVTGVFNRDLWLHLPSQQTVLHARADLPLWEIEDETASASVSAPPPGPPLMNLPATIPFYAPAILWWEAHVVRRGVESIDGVPCDVVDVQPRRHLREKFKGHITIWLGRADRLPRQIEVADEAGRWRATVTIKELELNPALEESVFVMTVPAGAKQQEVPLEQVRRFLRVLPQFLEETL